MTELVNDVTEELFNLYRRTHTVNMMLDALKGDRPGVLIVFFGEQGSGKSTFAYYSLKVAYALHKCIVNRIPINGESDQCLRWLMRRHNLCLGRNCEPDGLDKEMRNWFFVTQGDIVRFSDFVNNLRDDDKRMPFVFLDDILIKSTYAAGGDFRRLYFAVSTFVQLYRGASRVTVFTVPSINALPEAVTETAVRAKVHRTIDSKTLQGIIKVGYGQVRYVRRYRYDADGRVLYEYYTKYFTIDPIDVVPIKTGYGLPAWLDKAIMRRKRHTMAKVSEWATRNMSPETMELFGYGDDED